MRVPIIRFGIVPLRDADELRPHLRRLCDDFGYFLGTTCEGIFVSDYDRLLKLISQAQIDLAWLPPMVALRARKENWADPLVAMVRRGEVQYYGALFVREDSDLHTVADLRGARVAWVSPDSASGYLVPRAMLHAIGIRTKQAFSEERFVGSHERVVYEVAEGRADVGAGFVHVRNPQDHDVSSASWTETDVTERFRVLSLSGPIPTDSLVLHRSLPRDLASEIQETFQWVQQRPSASSLQELFACDTLRSVKPSFVDPLDRLLRLGDVPQRPSHD